MLTNCSASLDAKICILDASSRKSGTNAGGVVGGWFCSAAALDASTNHARLVYNQYAAHAIASKDCADRGGKGVEKGCAIYFLSSTRRRSVRDVLMSDAIDLEGAAAVCRASAGEKAWVASVHRVQENNFILFL